MKVTFGDETLVFVLESSPIADMWVARMDQRHRWPMDDPRRFYHFDHADTERDRAETLIKQCIDTINRYQPVIQRVWTSVDDKDMLNYLHHIFEIYHGALDQQQHDFWRQAPDGVHRALRDLNIAVHRCEYLSIGHPRVVCTWFGMPKNEQIPLDLQSRWGRLDWEFGGVYLNYVEIGKTAQDLATDNDTYIADDMFKPFSHYSADFVITFYRQTEQECAPLLDKIDRYWQANRSFFQQFGIESSRDTRMMPLHFKVAQLLYEPGSESAILDTIRNNQVITSVELS